MNLCQGVVRRRSLRLSSISVSCRAMRSSSYLLRLSCKVIRCKGMQASSWHSHELEQWLFSSILLSLSLVSLLSLSEDVSSCGSLGAFLLTLRLHHHTHRCRRLHHHMRHCPPNIHHHLLHLLQRRTQSLVLSSWIS